MPYQIEKVKSFKILIGDEVDEDIINDWLKNMTGKIEILQREVKGIPEMPDYVNIVYFFREISY
jgi:hypothetical protein